MQSRVAVLHDLSGLSGHRQHRKLRFAPIYAKQRPRLAAACLIVENIAASTPPHPHALDQRNREEHESTRKSRLLLDLAEQVAACLPTSPTDIRTTLFDVLASKVAAKLAAKFNIEASRQSNFMQQNR